jgi:hypothetical protein
MKLKLTQSVRSKLLEHVLRMLVLGVLGCPCLMEATELTVASFQELTALESSVVPGDTMI